MDQNNLYHTGNLPDEALERAARQQAAMQEEQEALRARPQEPVYAQPAEPPVQPSAEPFTQAPHMETGSQPSTAQPSMGGAAAEPRTPYQVPVRDSAQPSETPRAAYTAPHAASGYTPHQEMPQGMQQPSAHAQWQAQQEAAQQAAKPPKKRGSGKRVLMVLGGAAAAAVLFFGGAAVGSGFGDFDAGGSSGSPSDTLPRVQSAITIAQAPNNAENIPGDVVYEMVNPSVVSITATSLTSNGGSLGSGIVMSEDGYIVTNHHVTENMDKFTIMLSDGTELSASLIAGDADTDVAVLKAETGGRKLTVPEFGDSDALRPGETCYAIGTPTAYRLTNSISTGSISAINRNITINDKVMTLIQTDAAINSGNSGGALVNKYGQVVGITNAKLSSNIFSTNASYEGLGFAIPINTAKEVVDELMTNGYVAGRPSIGISGSEISKATAESNEVPQGVLIQRIDSRAKAYTSGLAVRDIITGINGTEITTMDEINEVKNTFRAGDTITLTVYRMSTGETLDIRVELTDAHDLEGTDPAQVRPDEAESSQDNRGSANGGYNNYYSFPFGNFFGW